jgi:hypothetical protein
MLKRLSVTAGLKLMILRHFSGRFSSTPNASQKTLLTTVLPSIKPLIA